MLIPTAGTSPESESLGSSSKAALPVAFFFWGKRNRGFPPPGAQLAMHPAGPYPFHESQCGLSPRRTAIEPRPGPDDKSVSTRQAKVFLDFWRSVGLLCHTTVDSSLMPRTPGRHIQGESSPWRHAGFRFGDLEPAETGGGGGFHGEKKGRTP